MEAVETMEKVEPQSPDLYELRLDYMESINNLNMVRGATDRALIATNRRVDQGGGSSCSEESRVSALMKACDAGFEYIDLELSTESIVEVTDDVKSRGANMIISHHDFNDTPKIEVLDKILCEEIELGADIGKIVGTATHQKDNLTYLNFLQRKQGCKLVCFGMGRLGVMSRVFSPLVGGAFTYASAQKKRESAPGQMTISELKKIYRLIGV
jgi:3-dehydroquinate dehydratase type I